MPTFQITGPDGKKYRVTGETADGALAAVQGAMAEAQHPEFVPPDSVQPGMGTSFALGAIEGVPVVGPYLKSGVESAAAGIASMLSGDDYDLVRKDMSEISDMAKKANPKSNIVGNVTGAVAGTLPLVYAAPGAFGAGSGGLLGRTLASSASGAALGGADAATRSGSDPDAIKSGLLWGAGLGAVAPGVGALVGKGVGKLAGAPAASKGKRLFAQAALADDLGEDIAQRMAASGGETMPMDMGANMRGTAAAVANRPGPGQSTIRDALNKRAQGAGQRVLGAVDDALGQNVDTLALADDIIARRSAQSAPLYDKAFSKPINFTKDMESLLKRPSMSKALARGRGLSADEGISSKQWFANISDDGKVTIINTPDMRQLHYTKMGLDDMIGAAKRAGNNNEARILMQQKDMLVRMMDAAAPEYAMARNVYAGQSSIMDALEDGGKVFRNNMTPEQLRRTLAGKSGAEREAYIQGARAQIADMMGTARNDALKVRGEFQKGYNREKLQMLLGKQEADKLLQSLDSETMFANTRNEIIGNSATSARQEATKRLVGDNSGSIFRNFDFSRPGETLARLGDKAMGSAREKMVDDVAAELARILSDNTGQSARQAIQLIQRSQRSGLIPEREAKRLVQTIMLERAQNQGRPN